MYPALPRRPGRSVVVDSYEGTRFNSPNDLAYTSDGSLYFTDPAYGLPPETQGQGVDAIYRLDPGWHRHTVDRSRRRQWARVLA